jgi:hypothetical protein
MYNKNNMCIHFNDVKRILIKRFGSDYSSIKSNDIIDFALRCELFYMLEQLNLKYPEYYQHKNFIRYIKNNPRFEKTLNKNIPSIRIYDDLVLLINLILFASNPYILQTDKENFYAMKLVDVKRDIIPLITLQNEIHKKLELSKNNLTLTIASRFGVQNFSKSDYATVSMEIDKHILRSKSKFGLYSIISFTGIKSTNNIYAC